MAENAVAQTTSNRMIEIRNFVNSKIKSEIMQEMVKHVKTALKNNDIVFWGTKQPRFFVNDMVYLVIYREMEALSMEELCRIYHTHNLGHSSIENNINQIRFSLFGWARAIIVPGDFTEWKTAVRNVPLAPSIEDANLLIDSTDLHIQNDSSRGPSSEYWSGKEGCPAIRFMIIYDFKGKVRAVIGGYSPKVYDGALVHILHPFLYSCFSEGVFLADTHFNVVNKYFTIPKFHCTVPEKGNNASIGEPEEAINLSVATKKQLAKNKAIKGARGKVEKGIADCIKPFKSLQVKWRDDVIHLTYTFFIACAIRNLSL